MPVDPICGMQVSETTPHQTVRDGQTFYFCCPKCLTRFLATTPPASATCCQEIDLLPPGPTAPLNANYYCPMCEGVVSDLPGTCPRCGMALEGTGVHLVPGPDPEWQRTTRRLVGAIAGTIPLFLLAMIPMMLGHGTVPRWNRILQFLLSSPVVLWGGAPFFHRAWMSLRTLTPNMFTLIALGTGTAYVYSAVALLFPQWIPAGFQSHGQADVFFEAAGMITTLTLLGQWLELRARHQTGQALRALMELTPATAHVIYNGTEREVPLSEVRRGDLVRIRPGDKIPADGIVREGESHVDESVMTGESAPLSKQAHDEVLAGTVNLAGTFTLVVERLGSDTRLAQIVELVSQAQRSRAPIQQLVDRVAWYFVPAVVLAALVTWGAWMYWPIADPPFSYALLRAIAVLIVACPCAMGLATPMSLVVGLGRGAQEGILIRNATVLESLAQVDTVVIDKTGTLTMSQPTVLDVLPTTGQTVEAVLRTAASLEQYSEHPLAQALVNEAAHRAIPLVPLQRFQAEAGRGVRAESQGETWLAGNLAFLQQSHVKVAAEWGGPLERMRQQGGSVIYVAVGGQLQGGIVVADPIRPSAPAGIAALRQMGLHVLLLSGDAIPTVAAVAAQLRIESAVGALLPQDKHARITALRQAGHRVAMVGDGINDGPALAAADVGIAMGKGADVAIESAGVTLATNDLEAIAKAIRLSRATRTNIQQNLAFALGYNALSIPLAAGALIPLGIPFAFHPMVAALAMSFSSVSVIANALRLRRASLGSGTPS